MAVQLDENIQYTDPLSGKLLVNGYIYIGTSGLDAKLNQITIYSDRALSTLSQLANPQRTGADGRAVNKIWIPGKYSLKVEDSANVQKLDDRDLGESDTNINSLALGNVQGTNTITAEGSPTVLSLFDKQTYIFIAVAENTSAVTLKIDATTAYPVKKDNEEYVSGEIKANQIMVVLWNTTSSIFEAINFNTTRIKTPAPELILEETGAAANNGIWGLLADGEQLKLRVGNDAESSFVNILVVDRTANVVDLVNFLSTNLQHNGVKIPTISSTDTQTNKTLTSPTIANFTNANHDHSDASKGGNIPTAGLADNAVTKLKVANKTVGALEFDTDPAFIQTGLSLGATSTVTIPEGIYQLTTDGVDIEILIDSTWYFLYNGGGLVISDGTNVRINNTTGSSITYRFHQF